MYSNQFVLKLFDVIEFYRIKPAPELRRVR